MRIRALSLVVASTVIFSGCQMGPPTPTPTPTPTASTTVTGSPASPAYDIDCATAIPAEAFVGFFGTDALADTGHVEPPVDPAVIALRQAGGIACAWTDDRTVDNQAYPVGLHVSVLPDGAKGYDQWISVFINRPPGIDDAAGDDSFQWCAHGSCGFEMLVGTAWVRGVLVRESGDMDAAAITPLMEALATAVDAGGPERLPVLADSPLGWGFCEPGDATVSTLQNAWGLDDIEILHSDEAGSTAGDRIGAHFCHVVDADGNAVVARLIPGAAWAVDEILADPPSSTVYQGVYAPVSLPRFGTAAVVCGDDGCKAFLPVGDDVLVVQTSGIDDDDTLDGLAAFAESVRGLFAAS
jgi:hypothetical protein